MTFTLDVPVIETERLILRALTMADFPAYRDAFASQRTQYVGGPLDELQSWSNFCKETAPWTLTGLGAWAVEERDSGAFTGVIGFYNHPYFPEVELGWMVLPTGEGKGIAYEAAQAARHWAYDSAGLSTLVSYIHCDNARSIALAERLGARLDPDAPACPYANHVTYRHPGPEALA
ncbi:MAG: GNAT family N-acetyltransferase [Rhodobacterales bacterium]|nr:MAG: GNAT family N-acetyltransferase [Rhodobacterales bacterium]